MTRSYTPPQIADGLLSGKFTRDSAFIPLAEVERLRAERDEARAEVERLRAALDQLARLGNEPNFGNSFGNVLARRALEAKP